MDSTLTTSFGDAHAPPMMEDIVLSEDDHIWLKVLAGKILEAEQSVRKQLRALEYSYRAWPLDPHERFPWLFMALDAIFGDAAKATQAVVEAVKLETEGEFDDVRLRILLGLRASVIHGGAPDVYDSGKYQKCYMKYGNDPISDLERAVAHCLRSIIFDGNLKEHPNPYAHLMPA